MNIHDVDVYVGAQVRRFREYRGMTQQQLAQQVGVSFQQIHKYERGQDTIRGTRLHQVSRALGVDAADLFPTMHSNPDYAEVMELAKRLSVNELEQVNALVLKLLDEERGR